MQIYETATSNLFFTTAAVTLSTPVVSHLWGLTHVAPGDATKCAVGLYYDKASSTNAYYNAIRISFTSAATPSGQNVILTISFNSAGIVNEASIVTNFP